MKISTPASFRSRKAFVCFLAAGMAVAGLAWAAARAVVTWREDAEVGIARRDVAEGRYGAARDRLARLAGRQPARDEVEYLLGLCEASLGHIGPALEAWGRVRVESPMRAAALARGKLALDHGRLATAEVSLSGLADSSGHIGEEARRLADQVDLYLGRARAISRRIELRWASSADPAAQLRLHWLLESQPLPVEPVRAALDRFEAEASDDDSIWLARADLADRTGRHDEADAWLRRCESRRPDDPEVLRRRLTWALDSGRPEVVALVAARLPAAGVEPDQIASIAARLADLRNDREGERRALERLAKLRQGDAPAWGRLAELAALAGQPERSIQCRRRKAEIDRDRDAYRMLVGVSESLKVADLAGLGRLAERLGRVFEARGWWTLRLREVPGDSEAKSALARLTDPDRPPPPNGTLAERIGLGAEPAVAARREAPPGIPAFADEAESFGLKFVYDQDPSVLHRLPETMGGGLGLIDYDSDGHLDVFCVQGGPFPGGSAGPSGGDRLFRNRGEGSFEDVTERSGLASFARGYGHGVAVGDFDSDGHPDLFVTRWRTYALYRNKGDGTFEDATGRAGLAGPRGWPTSSAFADLDGDGDLDLYVCHYLAWDPEKSEPCRDPTRPSATTIACPRRSPPSPTTSSATTAAGSST